MNSLLKVLIIWLITAGASLLAVFLIVLPMIPLIVRNLVIMHWTRPSEIPRDHPLLDVTERQVRYLGGEQYPLPRKFAWFGCAFFIGFFPPFTLFMAMNSCVPSLWLRIVIMLAVQFALMALLIRIFRRLQPRWLRAHLATLPHNAVAPASGAVA